ncbi:MAG: VOC family protein [Planctomycetes bacterium]|nr:VOC family protein [Planctomycetota bacterium]
MPARPIPEGFHSLTPHLELRGAARAIDFYKAAFGAREIFRNLGPDGRLVMHAQLQIGDSMLLLHDEFAESGGESPDSLEGSAVTLHLYVPDVDAVFARAVAAGATVEMPVSDMFWGDRYGQIKDPCGHRWSIGTKIEDLTPAQMRERAAKFFQKH